MSSIRMPAEWPEHDYIRRQLPRHGYRAVARSLGKHPQTVWAYAARHGIEHGDIAGYVRVAGLAKRAGVAYQHVYQRAIADGVMHRVGSVKLHPRSRPCLVPQEWADAFLTELETKRAGDELITEADWLTVPQVQKAWQVGRGTILRGLNGKGVIAELLKQESVRTARATAAHRLGRWIVEPYGAERIRRRLENDRRRAKKLISTKSISIEAGVSQTYAADVGKELGGEHLFVHGRIMCFVTPEVAEIMRARFRDGITPGKHRGRPRGSKDLQPRRKAL